jgi:4-oxalocrotonate tautomerase
MEEKNMPLVEVKVFKDELTAEQAQALIQRITDAVAEVTSPKLRPVTWVVIQEIKDRNWGVGGEALALVEVKRMVGWVE